MSVVLGGDDPSDVGAVTLLVDGLVRRCGVKTNEVPLVLVTVAPSTSTPDRSGWLASTPVSNVATVTPAPAPARERAVPMAANAHWLGSKSDWRHAVTGPGRAAEASAGRATAARGG